MLTKEIKWFNRKAILACDGKCSKAFGINLREKINLDPNDEDDYYYLSDDEVGIAPIDTGIYEGGHPKPNNESQKLNKWCARECERSSIFEIGEEIKLTDFSKPVYNKHFRNTIES